MTPLAFLVPGRLDQVTGGYLYDRRIVEGLRAAGRRIEVVELAGNHQPVADPAARRAVSAALAELPEGSAVVLDGLVLAAAETCLPAASRRLRLIAFVHHPLALETGLSRGEGERLAALERRLLPLMCGIICPSRVTATALAAYGVPLARIAVVPPGTDKPPAPAGRRGSGPARLLTVATVTPRKGHLLAAAALAGLAGLDWSWLCVGSLSRDRQTSQALAAAVGRDGLAGRVTLAGEWPPERLPEAYMAADCFLLPSYHEGYGMAFAEALAQGLPIVAARAGAVPELVPPGAGLLVPPGDAAALGGALRRILTEPGLRARLAAGAAAAGAALPDWTTSVRRWGEAFDRLAAALPAVSAGPQPI